MLIVPTYLFLIYVYLKKEPRPVAGGVALILSVVVFGVAFVLQRKDRNKAKDVSRNSIDGVFPHWLHAAWHVLAAAAITILFFSVSHIDADFTPLW